MIFSIKHVLIFGLLLTGFLLYGVLHQKTEPKDDLIPLEEQYSDDELAVYETVYNTCVTDIKNIYKETEPHIVVLTCQCVAKRVLRKDIETDNDLKMLYNTSKQDCYELTLKHIGKD